MFSVSGQEVPETITLTEVREEMTHYDQLEKEMLDEVQALFSKYREKLEQLKTAEKNGNPTLLHSSV